MTHIVCEQQDKIEVYANEAGGISIRQHCYPDEDQVIGIPPEKITALIEAIQSAAKDLED
jgi:hypothetical protein